MENVLSFHAIVRKSLFLTVIFLALLSCNLKLPAQELASANTKTVAEVLEFIEEVSDYHVFYQNNQLDISKKVAIHPKTNDIDDLLDHILEGSGLTFKYIDDQIVIIPGSTRVVQPDIPVISGRVTDVQGMPLPGVNILLKGTYKGTISDFDGNYSFETDSLSGTLIFSFLGFETQIIPIEGRTTIDVVLKEDIVALEEIVAIGYGTRKKADLTGSVSVVSSQEIANLPVATIDQALQGKATGVKVTQSTGAPGEGIAVRIRGVGTINDNTPLYVIDGIPTKTGFNALSPGDIESISVLKDASASIYGARAANGVILITTKRGSVSETAKISYEMYTGMQQAYNLTEMCNKDQYIELYNEAALADGRSLIIEDMADTLPDINWWEEIFRPALITNHHLTVSGGSDKSNYIISGNYFKQDGIILNSGYDRYSIRSGVNSKLTDKLSTGININLARSSMDVIGSSGDGYMGNGGSVVRYAFFRTPIFPVYEDNGDFVDYYPQSAFFLGDGYNPVGLAEKFDWTKTTYQVFGDIYVEYKILNDLTFRSSYGLDYGVIDDKRFNENWGYNNRINDPNSIRHENIFNTITTWKNTFNYDKNINDIHSFNFLLGSEAIKSNTKRQAGEAKNFPDQIENLRYLSNGLTNPQVEGFEEGWALFSVFGRLSYNYQSKYFTEFILRRDGSSRFGNNYPYGTFPAATFGWRIDREKLLENVSWMSHLKLRLSYGKMGNQEISNYGFSSLMTSGAYYPFTSTPATGYYLARYGNENIRWESQTQYDAGIDIGLWENKLFLYFDIYRKLSEDVLLEVPLPPSSGNATAPWINAAKIQNQGVEAELIYKNQIRQLKYSAGLVFSTYKNEVKELYGGKPIPAGRIDNGVYASLTEEGYPIGSFFLYEMEGIFQDTAEILAHAYQGANIFPGDVKFRDISGPEGVPDDTINSYDRAHVGSPIPDFSYGLNLGLNYRNWNVSMFWEGVYGNEIYWQAAHDIEGFYRAFNITERVYDERWTGPETSNTQPRVSWSGATNNKKPSTRFLFDASYLRFKNFNIGYTFRQEFVKKLGMESLKVYVSAQNIYTFTKYPGLDPEMHTSDNGKEDGDLAVGIDWGTYPSARVFNFGINVIF